ncbi:MAG: TadE/TadG family type IV pilus assembly protein [Parvibaculaceae bacterium]
MSCARGNIALSFALAAIPLIGVAGFAVDYARASYVRAYLQGEADAAALGTASTGKDSKATSWMDTFRAKVSEQLAHDTSTTNVEVTGEWISSSDYRVTASGQVPLTLLSIVPGLSESFRVEVESIAQIIKPKLVYKPPKLTNLDPDASDYNRIYIYCFNPAEASSHTKGRSKETAIADNAGTKYSYEMPECKAGESLSYRLHNVRNARQNKSLWDSPQAEHYDYYTDTVTIGGVEQYGLKLELLETVLCNTAQQCVEKSKGGILPEGPNRTPERSAKACQAGKFMYYGWEDRPPGVGWSDRDYNDIRILIECPTSESTGDLTVRLIK